MIDGLCCTTPPIDDSHHMDDFAYWWALIPVSSRLSSTNWMHNWYFMPRGRTLARLFHACRLGSSAERASINSSPLPLNPISSSLSIVIILHYQTIEPRRIPLHRAYYRVIVLISILSGHRTFLRSEDISLSLAWPIWFGEQLLINWYRKKILLNISSQKS